MILADDDDGIDLLIGAGVLVLVGVGVYKVLKAVGSYKAEQIISTPKQQPSQRTFHNPIFNGISLLR